MSNSCNVAQDDGSMTNGDGTSHHSSNAPPNPPHVNTNTSVFFPPAGGSVGSRGARLSSGGLNVGPGVAMSTPVRLVVGSGTVRLFSVGLNVGSGFDMPCSFGLDVSTGVLPLH